MKIRRKLKVLVGATAIGAATAYLMDPAQGRQRRNRLAEVAERRSNDVRHLVKSAERVKEAVTPESEPSDTAELEGSPDVAGVTDVSETAEQTERTDDAPAGITA